MQHIQDFPGQRTPGDGARRDARQDRDMNEPVETITDGEAQVELAPSLLARLKADASPHRRSLFRR